MRDQTEIIVMLTPHIVRMPNIQDVNMRGLYTGSETIPRLRTSPAIPAIGGQTPAATPAPQASTAPGTPSVTPPVTTLPPPVTNPAQAELRQTNATLTFAPTPVTVAANGQTLVNVVINGNDIFAADLTLSYDPSSFTIREVREGGFLSRDGQLVAVVQRLDTQTGMATISLERPPGTAALSGTGNLATLVLDRGARAGDSTLRITDFRVRDAQQNVQIGRASEVRVTAP